jgi:hypothetical protein
MRSAVPWTFDDQKALRVDALMIATAADESGSEPSIARTGYPSVLRRNVGIGAWKR